MVLSEVFTNVIAHLMERWVSHGLKLAAFGQVKRRSIQEIGRLENRFWVHNYGLLISQPSPVNRSR